MIWITRPVASLRPGDWLCWSDSLMLVISIRMTCTHLIEVRFLDNDGTGRSVWTPDTHVRVIKL